MDILVFAPMCFYCFKGNVGNMAVSRKCRNHQRAKLCHFYSLFNVVQKIKISPGGGGLWPAKGLTTLKS